MDVADEKKHPQQVDHYAAWTHDGKPALGLNLSPDARGNEATPIVNRPINRFGDIATKTFNPGPGINSLTAPNDNDKVTTTSRRQRCCFRKKCIVLNAHQTRL